MTLVLKSDVVERMRIAKYVRSIMIAWCEK
jgi:hypothetical protein